MNSEERFKKDLNDLLGSKEFAFDEANWEKAKEMIDASKKTKRRPLAYLISGAILFLSLLTGFYMLVDNDTPVATHTAPVTKNKAAAKTDSKPINEQPSASSKTQFQKTPASETHASVLTKPEIQKPVINNQEHGPDKTPLVGKEPEMNHGSVKTGASQSHSPSASQLSTSSLAPEVKEMKEETTHTIETGITVGQTSELTPRELAEKESHQSNINLTTTEEASATVAIKETAPSEPVIKTPATDVEPAITEMKKESGSLQETEITTALSPEKENALSETSPSVKNDSLSKESIAVTQPSIAPENTDPTYDGVEPEPKYQGIRFSIEAGTSYLYGWKNPKNRDANGFNPVFGLNCFNTFSPKLSFSFGLQYTSVSKLSYSNYTSKIIRLKLGEESDVSVYTPIKMHYVIFPLRLNYDLNFRNTIGLGCNAAYLVNLESELETYTEKPNSTEGYNITKTYGYTQGFKKYDAQASVFYKRRLYPNLSANVEAFFGLTDIKDNDFFKLNAFERNAGVKLTLVYNILKK